jgi:hypothetical protein
MRSILLFTCELYIGQRVHININALVSAIYPKLLHQFKCGFQHIVRNIVGYSMAKTRSMYEGHIENAERAGNGGKSGKSYELIAIA